MGNMDQVKLALSKEPEILAALERKHSLQTDKDGTRTLELLFDSRPFTFRLYKSGERNVIPVPATVANALRSDSRVLIGDPLSGQFRSALTVLGRYNQAEGDPDLRLTKTSCPFCRTECNDPRALSRHLMVDCQDPAAGVPSVLARIEKEKAEVAKAEAAAAKQKERPESDFRGIPSESEELVSAEDEV
jgi:hypothetical protein